MPKKMKDSNIEWIGEIPEDWDVIQLRNATYQINESNNPIKFTNILSLTNTQGVIPYEQKGSLGNISKNDISQYKIAYKNTVIINSMNLKIGSVGLSNYDGCVSPVYYVLKNKKNFDIKFINYIFQSNFQKYLSKYGKGIMEIREKIPMYDVLHSYIPFPTQEEQTKIANFLDDKCSKIDKAIELNKKAIEKEKEYKYSIITKITEQGIKNVNKKEVNWWIKEIPINWKQNKIKNICVFNPSYSNKFKNAEDVGYVPMDLLKIGYAELQEINYNKAPTGLTKFINNDVIMAKVTPCFENGEIAIVNNLKNDIGVGSSELFVFNCDKINNRYLYYLLQNNNVKQLFISTMKGTGGLKRIAPDYVKNLIVPIPDKTEQKEIADYLDDKCNQIDKMIKIRQKYIEQLQEYKKSLIYEAVTGKIEV